MIEYVIWGIPKGQSEETLLASEKAGLKSMKQARAAAKRLESEFGCTRCRIQKVDLRENPTAAFIKAINL